MLKWLSSKRPQITNVGEDMEKKEPLYTVGGNVNWCNHYGKWYGYSSKFENRTTISSSNSTPGYKAKENENTNLKRYTHFNVHSSIIYNSQDM